MSFETFRGRKKGYASPHAPIDTLQCGQDVSCHRSPVRTQGLLSPGEPSLLQVWTLVMDPAGLPPFYQALVEMLGDLTACFSYWQRLALVCAHVHVCVYVRVCVCARAQWEVVEEAFLWL